MRTKPTFESLAKSKKGKAPKQLNALTKHLYDHENSLLSRLASSDYNLYKLAVNPPPRAKPARPSVPVFQEPPSSSRSSSRSLSFRSTSPLSRDEVRGRIAASK
jgi:hypothetical protein